MRLSLKYALYLSVVNIILLTSVFAISEWLLWHDATRLENELHQQAITEYRQTQEHTLIKTADYLSQRLFNPLYQTQVGLLNRIIDNELKMWLPLERVWVANVEGFVITDGTPENSAFLQTLSVPLDELNAQTAILRSLEHGYFLAFAVKSEQTIAGYVELELNDDALQAAVERQSFSIASTLNQFIDSLRNIGLFALVVILLLTILFSWLVSVSLSKPLIRLRKAAINIAKGNFTHQLAVSSKDEIGDVITSFNIMATDLKHYTNELKQAKTVAESANQAKTVFLANVSHELRTPLNAILGYAQLLQRDHLSPQQQHHGIETIQQSGEHLLTLINDILDLAKMEEGHMALFPVDFHLPNFLQELVDMFRIRAHQKSLQFHYQPSVTLPLGVHADDKRLRQILINLLSNAVKFTHSGSIRLEVHWQADMLTCTISDTGVGIPEAILPYIFTPFQQTGDKYQKAEGAGLGLSITQKLIEMMEGSIQVESVLRKGSCFEFQIPCAQTHYVPIHTTVSPTLVISDICGYETSAAHNSPYTVLLAEKNDLNREVLSALLTDLGFHLLLADSRQQILSAALTTAPDLLIIDLLLPALEGIQTIRQLRTHHQFAQTPIIGVTTASADQPQMALLRSSGCSTFLYKPYTMTELLQCLQTHLALTWRFHANAQAMNLDAIPLEVMHSENENQHLTAEQAEQLHELAQMGDFHALSHYLASLVEANAGLTVLTQELQQFADNFDDTAIIQRVQPYLSQATTTL